MTPVVVRGLEVDDKVRSLLSKISINWMKGGKGGRELQMIGKAMALRMEKL